jgi:hypothetical protein
MRQKQKAGIGRVRRLAADAQDLTQDGNRLRPDPGTARSASLALRVCKPASVKINRAARQACDIRITHRGIDAQQNRGLQVHGHRHGRQASDFPRLQESHGTGGPGNSNGLGRRPIEFQAELHCCHMADCHRPFEDPPRQPDEVVETDQPSPHSQGRPVRRKVLGAEFIHAAIAPEMPDQAGANAVIVPPRQLCKLSQVDSSLHARKELIDEVGDGQAIGWVCWRQSAREQPVFFAQPVGQRAVGVAQWAEVVDLAFDFPAPLLGVSAGCKRIRGIWFSDLVGCPA